MTRTETKEAPVNGPKEMGIYELSGEKFSIIILGRFSEL